MEENGQYHPDWILPDGSINIELKKKQEKKNGNKDSI
jgi:hypothetical protein